jgi:hypothetical protein
MAKNCQILTRAMMEGMASVPRYRHLAIRTVMVEMMDIAVKTGPMIGK